MNFHGSIPAAIFGIVIVCVVLLDAFETVVLPRRVTRHFKLTAWFYRRTWIPWRKYCRTHSDLFAAAEFSGILRAAVADYAAGVLGGDPDLRLCACCNMASAGTNNSAVNRSRLAESSTTAARRFFTLGYGDILPTSPLARFLSVLEAGMGFAFLGVVIGYLPVVYASFSRREIQISMLDARAGSPPTATELLVRLAGTTENPAIDQLVLDGCLRDWERWAGELLESHISYPVLSFFRSQHSNQSWLAALMTMLDVTSLVMTGIEGIHPGQARLTFAMARHAAVDLAQVVNARYDPAAAERLPDADFDGLRETLAAAGLKLRTGDEARQKLNKLRSMYEPYLHSMGKNLMLSLPPWKNPVKTRDNWQAGPWDRMIQAKGLAVLGQKPLQAPATRIISDLEVAIS